MPFYTYDKIAENTLKKIYSPLFYNYQIFVFYCLLCLSVLFLAKSLEDFKTCSNFYHSKIAQR